MLIRNLDFIQANPQSVQGGGRNWFKRFSDASVTILADTLAVGSKTNNITVIEAAALTNPDGSSLSAVSVGIQLTSTSWASLML